LRSKDQRGAPTRAILRENPPCDDGSVTQLSRDADSMIVKSTEYDNEAGMGFADRIV
jgi:hypothetical protein